MIERISQTLMTTRVATFSECMAYRYSLVITWSLEVKPQLFIALNPSTADENQDDPTVRRCIDYARRWGAGGLIMANAFAFRATDPRVMLAHPEPIGPENTAEYLRSLAVRCGGNPIAAWGNKGKHLGRHKELFLAFHRLDCLDINNDGTPVHPLYQRADLRPSAYNYIPEEA